MGKIIKRIMSLLGITIVMIVILLYLVMWICVNGPSQRARELFVLSVRETSAVGFLANIYMSNDEIEAVEAANKVVVDEITNTELIKVDNVEVTSPDNNVNSGAIETGKDGSVLEETIAKEIQDLEFVDVKGSTYKGIMMIVADPSRVIVGTSSPVYEEGVPGKKVVDMISSYGAEAGVNAGGFEDPQGAGDGGIPKGIVISEGTLRYGNLDSNYEIIGFNNDNVLIVGSMTGQKALDYGIRDAISFGPILIVNGEATAASTGGGLNPRTAIGQRSDGAVLILVIDGRQSSSLGASYGDITDIMLEFGAVNAANLDGGSSSVMYHNGELLNSCSSLYGPREMPTSIIVR